MRLGPAQHLGPHPKFNAAVKRKLDSILETNPRISDAQAAQFVRDYVSRLRRGLERSNSKLR